MAAIDKLGNGVGYTFICDNGNNIIATYDNTAANVRPLLDDALISAPLSGEVLSSSTLLVASNQDPDATITSVVINGVTITNATVTGATSALLIAAVVSNINNYVSSPDYTAFAVTGGFVVQAAAWTGSTPNSYVTAVNGAHLTKTTPVMSGGSTSSGVYSSGANGHRYYIYADSAAVEGSISGATEISSLIIARSSLSGQVTATATIASGVVSPTRSAQEQQYVIDTEAAAASDDLDTLSSAGFVNGDVLEIRGANSARVITLTESGNIQLANSAAFLTAGNRSSIQLQYVSAVDKWVEIFRSPGLSFGTTSVRAAGIPWAVPGVTVTTLTNGGGSVDLTPGVSKGIQYLNGSPNLAGSWVYTSTGGTPIDGDTFYIIYKATPTLNANTITLFGALLTSTQATSGKVMIRAVYSSSLAAFITSITDDFNFIDYPTTASVAAKEASLGNPAADGYLLASTTGGTRSWVPNTGFTNTNVLSAPTYASVGTGADLLETVLKTYTLVANSMATNGTQVVIEARGFFAANANTKTIKVYFGSQVVATWTSVLNNNVFKLRATVTRETNAAQYGDVEIFAAVSATAGTAYVYTNLSLTQDLTTDLTLKVTGTNGTATANDIVASYMSVKIFNA